MFFGFGWEGSLINVISTCLLRAWFWSIRYSSRGIAWAECCSWRSFMETIRTGSLAWYHLAWATRTSWGRFATFDYTFLGAPALHWAWFEAHHMHKGTLTPKGYLEPEPLAFDLSTAWRMLDHKDNEKFSQAQTDAKHSFLIWTYFFSWSVRVLLPMEWSPSIFWLKQFTHRV